MKKYEIIERLKNIAEHAVYIVGKEPFVMSLDDGIAVCEAIELLKKPETNCSDIPNNLDTISRQAVIDAFETAVKSGASIEDIKWIFENLPSIQIKRKKGRWIPTYSNYGFDVWVKWKCSECGYVRKEGWEREEPDVLFCEMCNTDMRGNKYEID